MSQNIGCWNRLAARCPAWPRPFLERKPAFFNELNQLVGQLVTRLNHKFAIMLTEYGGPRANISPAESDRVRHDTGQNTL